PADRLARLAHRLAGHRAGVEHHRVGEPVGGRLLADDLALVGVEAAAEGDDVDVLHGSSPAKSTAAGPVISTWSSARHSTSSSPPSSTRVAARPVRSRRAAATTAAQAPVPQAWVSPAPRSQTRRRMRSRPRTWAKPTLTPSGNSGWRSMAAPTVA